MTPTSSLLGVGVFDFCHQFAIGLQRLFLESSHGVPERGLDEVQIALRGLDVRVPHQLLDGLHRDVLGREPRPIGVR